MQGGAVESSTKNNLEQDKIKVFVSILPQKYFVECIGGDKVEVSVMIPPGASPAAYEPDTGQLKALSETDMYIKIGHVPFEKIWMDRFAAANKNMFIVDSSKSIDIKNNDPHIWLSPALGKTQAVNIANALNEVDVQNKDYYKANLEHFNEEMDSLDSELKDKFAGLKNRTFMVYHPSWGYFANQYDLEQLPVEIEGKEPTARELNELIDTARAKNIKVIFASPQFDTRSVQAIASEIGAELQLIDPLALDYPGNLRAVGDKLAEGLE